MTVPAYTRICFGVLSWVSESRIQDRGCLRTGKSLKTAVRTLRNIASMAAIVVLGRLIRLSLHRERALTDIGIIKMRWLSNEAVKVELPRELRCG
jgi:hypothetical protein